MYDTIISLENLLEAWKEFIKGKRSKDDVQRFQYQLSNNVMSLYDDLKSKTYVHGGYHAFNISDPKPRNIHKASVRDRLLHHAIYRQLYPIFDKKFIHDSYSCRKLRGTHKAVERFKHFANKISKNHTRTVWVLKCDIKKFFASVDQVTLIKILEMPDVDQSTIDLIKRVTDSFQSTAVGKGLPLGNLTSQLLVNIYMNEFDQYVKHVLKQKYYIRYADDFVFMGIDREHLVEITPKIKAFLSEKLALTIHPKKMSLNTFASGVDFLGWIHFSDHRVLRTATKNRMFKKLIDQSKDRLTSYLGMLSHGNTKKIKSKVTQLSCD